MVHLKEDRVCMAQYRKSVAMREQAKKLFEKGFGIRKIARALKISKNTVKSILRGNIENQSSTIQPHWAQTVNWDLVSQEYRKGVTLKVLHAENAPQVSYWVFRRHLQSKCPIANEVTMRLEHKVGEKAFIDFADGIDSKTSAFPVLF